MKKRIEKRKNARMNERRTGMDSDEKEEAEMG
jgi:hypothetical protein